MYATSLISSGDTATCLYNAPHEDEALPRVLPGKLLSLDAQCRKDRGTSACFVRFVALMPLLPIFVNIRQINGIILIFCTRIPFFRKTIEFALSCFVSTLDPDTAWRIVRQPKAHLAGTVRYDERKKKKICILRDNIFLLLEILFFFLLVAHISTTINSINVER